MEDSEGKWQRIARESAIRLALPIQCGYKYLFVKEGNYETIIKQISKLTAKNTIAKQTDRQPGWCGVLSPLLVQTHLPLDTVVRRP